MQFEEDALLQSSGDETGANKAGLSDTEAAESLINLSGQGFGKLSLGDQSPQVNGNRKRIANTPQNNVDKKKATSVARILVERTNGPMHEGVAASLFRKLSVLQDRIPVGADSPTFIGHGFQQGALWIEAANASSLDWLVNAIESFGTTAEKRFVIKPYTPPPFLRRVVAVLPPFGPKKLDYDEIKVNFQLLIPGLNTESWRILAVTNSSRNQRNLVIG